MLFFRDMAANDNGRTRWSDDRLDDALIPLRHVPVAVRALEVETHNLREALEVNSAMQKQRNKIAVGFLVTLVVTLISAVVVLVVSL